MSRRLFACTAIAAFTLSSAAARAEENAEPPAPESPPPLHRSKSNERPKLHVLFDDLVGVGTFGGAGIVTSTGVISVSNSNGNGIRTSQYTLAPSFDVLVGDHLTLGGTIHAARVVVRMDATSSLGASQSYDGYNVDVIPRVGYLAPIGETVAVWPRAGLGYGTGEFNGLGDTGALGGVPVSGLGALYSPLATRDVIYATAEVTLTARMLDYVLFSIGPKATMAVASAENGQTTTRLEVGGRASLGLAF